MVGDPQRHSDGNHRVAEARARYCASPNTVSAVDEPARLIEIDEQALVEKLVAHVADSM
jgi:hypothetical protein